MQCPGNSSPPRTISLTAIVSWNPRKQIPLASKAKGPRAIPWMAAVKTGTPDVNAKASAVCKAHFQEIPWCSRGRMQRWRPLACVPWDHLCKPLDTVCTKPEDCPLGQSSRTPDIKTRAPDTNKSYPLCDTGSLV